MEARIPRYAVLDGSPLLQLRRFFILPLKQLCSSFIALIVNAPFSSFSRPPPDPPPYEYPPLEFSLSRHSSGTSRPSRCRPSCVLQSSPYQFVEGSILISFPDLPTHLPVTVLHVHHSSSLSVYLYSVEFIGTRVVWGTLNLGSMVLVVNVPMDRVSFGSTFVASERFLPALEEIPSDICYLLNMILKGIVLPVLSCLKLCLFPIFPLVWSELEAQELLILKGFSSQLMLSSAVDAVSVILWITLGTIIQEAYEIVAMRFLCFVVSSSNGV
ncbi:hypothetical protein IGI04_016396 [Brassica rapa subsp. trilocularis]|uniref:Uncharacterized protein n=1 Tax=Brassica rapa subsp. trilocularis TaxID=1813537 RepID=A0ABQ7MW97_BRACM|nr:hypothetical protein IGI04_016396 [Brassica rapa subsp. trilocularis]